MRFSTSKYWKHRGDCCDFIEIIKVIEDNGSTAELKAAMHTQLDGKWSMLLSSFQFRVPKKDYWKWNQFVPRGNKV